MRSKVVEMVQQRDRKELVELDYSVGTDFWNHESFYLSANTFETKINMQNFLGNTNLVWSANIQIGVAYRQHDDRKHHPSLSGRKEYM